MFLKKLVLAIINITSFSIAQTISISGTVLDINNVGIAGVTVKLEKADLTTNTGIDGTFILSNIVKAI